MPEAENNAIVANGGWIEVKRTYQKKALLFKTLAILWIVPTLTSVFVVGYGFPNGNGALETLKLIRLEQWLSFLVALLQPIFIYLAIRHKRSEIPTEQVFLSPNPDYDPKNLY